jgi:ribosomal protein RSM22 (predicted rRNA methylase)
MQQPDTSVRRAAVANQSLRLRRILAGTIRADPTLPAAAAALSAAYRSGAEPADLRGHIHDGPSAEAYAAARMPATFAAIARAMTATAERAPTFEPTTMLDVGAGTGAAAWASTAIWPGLTSLTLLDREPAAIALGRRLAASGPTAVAGATWLVSDAKAELSRSADLVAAGYVLGEIDDAARPDVVARLWRAATGLLVLVEPGSKAGFERIRTARAALIAAGGHVVAPCPGDEPCPIVGAAWCHFLARLDRSPLQRGAKQAARSWEDEPFSYVAISRAPADPAPRVVLGRPRQRPGMIELRICADGRIEPRVLSRRDGPAWRIARDLAWGDALPPEVSDRRDRAAPPDETPPRGDS